MTLRELRKRVNATPTAFDDVEVKVWLPGSFISLNNMSEGDGIRMYRPKYVLMLEGNIDPGSALSDRN